MRFLSYVLLLSSLIFAASPKITTTMSMQELNKLTASDGAASDQFGVSVAISGDTVVVGAHRGDDLGTNSGSAYLYERDTATGLFQQVAKLTASDGAAFDNFGISVAISGDTVVVGAYYDDDSGSDSGSAYLYEKPGTGWANATQSAKLTASDGAGDDWFGISVAVSGDTVVVGAWYDDDSGSDSGSAYLYEKPAAGWANTTQSAKLTASDGAAGDSLGWGVAISGDTVVVGAYGDDDSGSYSGSAYLYEKPAAGWENTTQSAKLTASDGAADDWFGRSVAISGDTVVVGAYGDDDLGTDSGSAYLYEKPINGWVNSNQESAKLLASDGDADDYFGISVAIGGDTVVVGAYGDDDSGSYSGSAYLYEKPGTGWADATQSAKLTASDGAAYDLFGFSVAISGDTVVVGAYLDDDLGTDSGSATIFKNAITQNSIENKKDIIDIEASDTDNDLFTYSLTRGDDLSLLAIDEETGLLSFKTAPNFENPQDFNGDNIYKATIKLTDDSSESDTYEAFIRVSDVAFEGEIPKAISFKELEKLTASNGADDNYFGYSTAVDGTTLVVGAYGYEGDTGRVYVYQYNPNLDLFEEVAQLRASDYTAGDRFGLSVAISGDMVVVGAYYNDDLGSDSGSVYIYEKPEDGWVNSWQENAKLLASDGAENDYFGRTIAINSDTVVVGAQGDDDLGSYSGSVYLYVKPDAGWVNSSQESAKLLASDGAVGDYFGFSVAVSGDTVVVGAYKDDDLGSESGSAYLYEKPTGGWVNSNQESAKLLASDGAVGDYFGVSVAFSGDTVVVGAYADDDLGSYSGSVYIYEKPAAGWENTTQSAKLLASDGAESDYFGRRVAISANMVVVGAYTDDDSGSASGSVYLYEKPYDGWRNSNQESAKLLASDGSTADYFGTSVAISGDTIVVGADKDNAPDSNSGSAYVFKGGATTAINPAIIMYLLN